MTKERGLFIGTLPLDMEGELHKLLDVERKIKDICLKGNHLPEDHSFQILHMMAHSLWEERKAAFLEQVAKRLQLPADKELVFDPHTLEIFEAADTGDSEDAEPEVFYGPQK